MLSTLTYADIRRRTLTYADVCEAHQAGGAESALAAEEAAEEEAAAVRIQAIVRGRSERARVQALRMDTHAEQAADVEEGADSALAEVEKHKD
jgi:hypothetical protein